MEDLTNTIGKFIRDTFRNDSEILSLLDIILADAHNHIFFTTPTEQVKGFDNPRIVLVPRPSDSDKLAYTTIFQGRELFQAQLWIDSKEDYDITINILDRMVTLFNKTNYTFLDGEGKPINFGEFICSGKFSFLDPDKKDTIKGELNISLNIGGI